MNGVFLRLNHSYIDEICAFKFNGTGITFGPCYDCVFGTVQANRCGNTDNYAMLFTGSGDQCNSNAISYLLCHDSYQHGIKMTMTASTINLIHIEASHFDDVIGSDETIYGTKHKNHELGGNSLTINQIWINNNQTTGLYETVTYYGTAYSNTINDISGNNIEVDLTGSTSPLTIDNVSAHIVATDSGAIVNILNGRIDVLKTNALRVTLTGVEILTDIEMFAGKMYNCDIIPEYVHKEAYQSFEPHYYSCWFRNGIGQSPRGGNIHCHDCLINGLTLDADIVEHAGKFYNCRFSGTVLLDGKNTYGKSLYAYNCAFSTMTWQNLNGGELITVGCKANSMTGWRTGWNANIGEVTERIFSEKPTSGTGLRYVCTGTATWPNEFTAIVSMP